MAALSVFGAERARAQGPLTAQGTPTEDGILALWLARSREVTSFRAQLGAARFDIVTATAWPNPQLQIAATKVVSQPAVPVGQDPATPVWGFSPQVAFPLPVLGQMSARKEAAMAAFSVAEVDVLVTLWERAADLKDAMLSLVFAQERMAALDRNLQELAGIADVVNARAAAGANPRYDVLRVGTTESTFRAALSSARIDRDQAEAKLLSLLAIPGLAKIEVTREALAPFHGPGSEAEMIAAGLARRPDLELARRQVAASLANAHHFERENVPVPNVYVGTTHTLDFPSFGLQAGVSFNLPVFDRNKGPIGRARAEATGNAALGEALETRIRAEITGAWRARVAAAEALEQFRRVGLATTGELLERAIVSYKAGSFAVLDLLDAYRAVWDARAQELDLARAFAEAEAEVERAAALITPSLAEGAPLPVHP
jgi:cobalt-zinc-cadmium efflux system outer membrane protein